MTEEIGPVIQVMADVYGRDISHFEETFFLKTLIRRCDATSIPVFGRYCEYLATHADEAEELYSSLHVSFSEFFRNSLTFAMLEHQVIPRLIEQKQKSGKTEIRVWSAGCSSGQESYSLAILLDDLISGLDKPVSYRIFATDISEAALCTGRRGVYDSMSVQNVRLKQIRSYFRSDRESWSVIQSLKDRVDFSFYDLLDEESSSPPGSIFGDFDLIFCSNLLFYYLSDAQQFILKKIHHALVDEGYLASGETERAIIENGGFFAEVCRPSAIFRKRTLSGDL